MAYLKLMLDEKEIAHLSEDGQYLCANEGVPQYDLPLNLFIGSSRKVPLVDVVVWAKKRISSQASAVSARALSYAGCAVWGIVRLISMPTAVTEPFTM